jgi:hypothetical protein
MPDHPQRQDLERYRHRTRTLAPAALLSIDRHLRSCAACAAALAPDALAPERLVRRVMAHAPHPGYRHFEACVDGTADAPLRERVHQHVRWCRRCAGELADLEQCAAALRQPLARTAPARSGWTSWLDGWRLPSLAGAALAAVFAAGVTLQSAWRPAADTQYHMPARPAAPGAIAEPEFDTGALAELDRVSPAAVIAYGKADYAGLADVLRPAAARGDAIAADALGLLHARGWGVARDLDAAARCWETAAQAGRSSAVRNLQAIGRR